MITQKISVVFATLLILTSLSVASVYGDHSMVDVEIPQGAGVPACAETNECYISSTVTVDKGGEVIWTNNDAAVHTVTAGVISGDVTGEDYPNGFDSGIFAAGQTFKNKFEVAGEYPYFCIVHPWMVGTVVVGGEEMMEDEMKHTDKMMDMEYSTMEIASMDDIVVRISTTGGSVGSPLSIDVEFQDTEGLVIPHVGYEIVAMQDGNMVLEESTHEHTGTGSHNTISLSTSAPDEPVDIKVTLVRIGLPDEAYNGPTGVVAQYKAVPEFGTIAIMILAVAIVSIIAISSRMNIISRI